MSTPDLATRQRADSWTETTPGRPAPAAAVNSSRMSILKRASAYSPFGFVRGSSPPKFEYEGAAVPVSLAVDSVQFPSLPSDPSAKHAARAAATPHESLSAPSLQLLGGNQEEDTLDGDDDDDDGGPVASDPVVAAAASRLVPQPRLAQRAESTMSFQSRYSAYEDADDDDASGDSNDGDDDEDDYDIDQETLDIMQVMEQLQLLQ
ncbi:hypothetical protein H4R21_002090 [Coemansia helicoidea]|uniref:Uncharacterized protein n=2 Tax=Coemansia TaxID=4863 RepID=A0ACC1L9R5_9FUNG|nr:hypothetical protein H4R21_002090 [Coemansia helicoidea]